MIEQMIDWFLYDRDLRHERELKSIHFLQNVKNPEFVKAQLF